MSEEILQKYPLLKNIQRILKHFFHILLKVAPLPLFVLLLNSNYIQG